MLHIRGAAANSSTFFEQSAFAYARLPKRHDRDDDDGAAAADDDDDDDNDDEGDDDDDDDADRRRRLRLGYSSTVRML
jgi:hypothetical protein